MFKNREEAGQLLAERLIKFKNKKNTVVLAIPRGGVVVGYSVAKKLVLPLDIVVVKKIGAPLNPELAIGAVGPDKTVFWDRDLIRELGISEEVQQAELDLIDAVRTKRENMFRKQRKPVALSGKTVLLVDDGVATGATIFAAQKYLKKKKIAKVILAVPVIAKGTLQIVAKLFDTVISLRIPTDFEAVGQFYKEFPQISDDIVIKILSN